MEKKWIFIITAALIGLCCLVSYIGVPYLGLIQLGIIIALAVFLAKVIKREDR